MRTYRLVIAYDGTAYQGWQRQANTEMTIQGILESCISKAAGYAVEVNGSGRTDAGVHARGQTASVVLHGKAEDGFFTEKVNKLLPPDIRIREAGLEKKWVSCEKECCRKKGMCIRLILMKSRMYLTGVTRIISRRNLILQRCSRQRNF